MNNRRDMMMRELGLAPVWRVRGQESGIRSQESEIRGQGTGDAQRSAGHSEATVAPPLAPGAAQQSTREASSERRGTILKLEWPALRAAVASCTACPLHAGRTKTVFGVGDEKASWLFVGEGPGADEDKQGEPFVGQAGKLLDNMLAAIDLCRGDDVYIANIVKCRPPKNRNPEPAEARSCEPYLTRQIELMRPKLIVALGKVAAQNLLDTDAPVGSLRGRLHEHEGVPVIVTYHPAYLLRNLTDKARAWEDLCFARATMISLKSALAAS